MKENNEIDIESFANRPHLVIVGAGATVDAIPTGDKNGKLSSVMNGFLGKLGFSDILQNAGITFNSDNLEDIYSFISEKEEYQSVKIRLEEAISDYFSSFVIPDEITKYDLLTLSLTKKDCIASFNWDGLLIDAYLRMMRITKDLPEIILLHGNVKVGYCESCNHFGHIKCHCPDCHKEFLPTNLLFPTNHKNYNDDPFIKSQWTIFEDFLSRAAIVTIYGYSAPKTDAEAISKLQTAFNKISTNRFLDEIQIIEKPGFDRSTISNAWVELSSHVHDHLTIVDSIFDTYLSEFPRRSVEGYVKRNIEGWWGDSSVSFTKDRGTNYTIDELSALVNPIFGIDPYTSLNQK